MLLREEYQHYRHAVYFSILLTVVTATFILIYGKTGSFLVINEYNSPRFDYFFMYLTYLGDGIIWLPLFLFTIFWKRDFLLAIIAAVIICTLLTHLFKRVIFPDDLRPAVLLKDHVHVVKGVRINTSNSFPSGHTSTAFTLALLLGFLVKRHFWTYFFPIVAFFVGYSRVYLAQHFVTDVTGGMVVGIISSFLSLLIWEKYKERRKTRRTG